MDSWTACVSTYLYVELMHNGLNSLSSEAEIGPEIQGSKVISPERVMDNLIITHKMIPCKFWVD